MCASPQTLGGVWPYQHSEVNMAIQCDYIWRGVTIADAYIRVDTIAGGKRDGFIVPEIPFDPKWRAVIGVYANANQPEPFIKLDISIPWDGDNSPYPGLYAALKSMPEFSGATDC